ncbi:unnamed protein product [Caenorhabditis nigoni]
MFKNINAHLCEKAIRFISNRIKHYTQQESFVRLAKEKTGYDKSADSFSKLIGRRLDRIEDLRGFTLVETFRSPDGTCVLQSEQNPDTNTRYFQGEPIQQQKTRSPNVRKPKPAPIQRVIPNPPEINGVDMGSEEEEAAVSEQIPGDSDEPSFGVDNESNNQNRVALVGNQSIDNNRLQNFLQNDQKRVKIEDFLEEIEQEPEVLVSERNSRNVRVFDK